MYRWWWRDWVNTDWLLKTWFGNQSKRRENLNLEEKKNKKERKWQLYTYELN